MSKKVRVVVLDDRQIVLDGYLYRLGKIRQIAVVDAIRFADRIEPCLRKHPTDVLLLDVSAPLALDDPTPLPIQYVIPNLLEKFPGLIILAMGMYSQRALVPAVLEAGACGFLLKDDQDTIENLGEVIVASMRGHVVVSERIRQYLVKSAEDDRALSPRQLEALSLAASYPNSTTAELARKMEIADSSIRNLLSSAYMKLGVGTRAAAITKARQMGILSSDRPTKPL